MSNSEYDIAGVALAGGLSSRMGQDKAAMRPAGNASLLDLALDRLSPLVSATFVSCAKGRTYSAYNCIEDVICGLGPLSGILSSMRALRKYRAILVLACDMPLMRSEMLLPLINAWRRNGGHCGLVAWMSSLSGKIQMLCTLYPVSSLPYFEKACAGRNLSLWNIVPEHLRLCLPYGPEKEKYFHNCNTLSDINCVPWNEVNREE